MHECLLLCSNLHTLHLCLVEKCNYHGIGAARAQERQSEPDSVYTKS